MRDAGAAPTQPGNGGGRRLHLVDSRNTVSGHDDGIPSKAHQPPIFVHRGNPHTSRSVQSKVNCSSRGQFVPCWRINFDSQPRFLGLVRPESIKKGHERRLTAWICRSKARQSRSRSTRSCEQWGQQSSVFVPAHCSPLLLARSAYASALPATPHPPCVASPRSALPCGLASPVPVLPRVFFSERLLFSTFAACGSAPHACAASALRASCRQSRTVDFGAAARLKVV